MITPDWPARFIGLAYSPTGEGPDAFHCWAFVRHVEREIFGLTLPSAPATAGYLEHAAALANPTERARWQEVDAPVDGDLVLLGHTRTPSHVGVWASADGGGVLHCFDPVGVVYQSRSRLAVQHWRIAGFYRFVGERP